MKTKTHGRLGIVALAAALAACRSATGDATPARVGGAAGSPGAGDSGARGADYAGGGACGDGAVGALESCDGSHFDHATCSLLGFSGGQLACSSSCQFDVSGCTGGTIKPRVIASRTRCSAPCAVFFDATSTPGLSGSDYTFANWSWDFNDPTSPHKGTIGFIAAHTFDSPGTYHVTTRVRDIAGSVGATTTTITVRAMRGTTYYVATNGKDSNRGTDVAHPFATFAAGMAHAAPQNSVLLRRGDTFRFSRSIAFATPGPFLIGAYTDPRAPSAAAPVLTTSVNPGVATISRNDIRLTDLKFAITNPANGQGIAVTASNDLLERVEFTGMVAQGVMFGIVASANPVFFFDCHEHDFNGYGLYGEIVNHFAMVGTTIDRFGGGEHGIRIQGGSGETAGRYATHSYFAENTISSNDNDGAIEAFTFRGDDKNIVAVYNTVNRSSDFSPQNGTGHCAGCNEHLLNGLLEGNLFYDPRSPAFTYQLGFRASAKHVMIRNNVFVNPLNAIAVIGAMDGDLGADWVDQIEVIGNTHYVVPAVGSGIYGNNALQSVIHAKTTGSLVTKNNIFVEGVVDNRSSFLQTDHAGTDTNDYNLIYAPHVSGSLSAPAVGPHGVIGDPQFTSTTPRTGFRLGPSSPARNSGTGAHAYQDAAAGVRPRESAVDIGAYEYVP